MINECNRTYIYGEIAQALWIPGGKEEKLGKEVEEKVIGMKSRSHVGKRFPTEFITGLGEGFVLISKVFSNKAQNKRTQNFTSSVFSLLMLPQYSGYSFASKATALPVSHESRT